MIDISNMKWIQTIWTEMVKGNFSFLILVVGVLQIFLMINQNHIKKIQ